jgi:hypothetical protein
MHDSIRGDRSGGGMPVLVTARQVAAWLSTTISAIYAKAERGTLPGAVRAGRRLYFIRSGVSRSGETGGGTQDGRKMVRGFSISTCGRQGGAHSKVLASAVQGRHGGVRAAAEDELLSPLRTTKEVPTFARYADEFMKTYVAWAPGIAQEWARPEDPAHEARDSGAAGGLGTCGRTWCSATRMALRSRGRPSRRP